MIPHLTEYIVHDSVLLLVYMQFLTILAQATMMSLISI